MNNAVGNKIALLMKEGKPQAQAVAIALELQRAGKLDVSGMTKAWAVGKHAAKAAKKMAVIGKGKK
jgi:hypothetical protein